MIEADMPTFMGQPYSVSPEDLEGADAVIIGSPYVVGWTNEYAGVDKKEWMAAPKRIRQQSIKYRSGYIQEFDLDLFEHLKLVDFGDAEIPPETFDRPTVDNILKAQHAVETKVNQVLDAGAIPIVIGQNSPCGSYAVAKPIAERTKGNVGVISLDTHWDIEPIDEITMDPRIAGGCSWKAKMYEFHKNMLQRNLVEIGERGMHESKERVREFLKKGTHWYPMWKVREMGIEGLCKELHHAYEGTKAIYVHYDMDALGGAGPASGDLLGMLAEPIGMTDYEVLRLSFEIGKRGFNALSFICIPPGSPVIYRTIVYVIMYMLAGKVLAKK
ncbi:MAG: arginase family protein [Candidatus Geothermarchaeales archaeon]